MKSYNLLVILSSLAIGLLVSSCEKAIIDDSNEEAGTTSEQSATSKDRSTANVILRVSGFSQVPFSAPVTKSVVDLTTYCTRLNFVVYKDGEKVKGLSQMKENSGFGEVGMSLEPGTYKLLVLAHSSVGGNPTVSDPEAIHFTNDLGYSDTFSYYGDIVVTSAPKTHELLLTRNVSCLRFTINDDFPSNVKYMKFYYTGGSGVLNAVTGFGGNVNSKQEKLVDVSPYSAPLTFNLYTFLQQEEATLQVKVTALEADKSTVVIERTFSDVPMKHHMVTEYTGYFFNVDNSFGIKAETDWGDPYQQIEY